MISELKQFILQKDFPCIMAKAVAQKGLFRVTEIFEDKGIDTEGILQEFYLFIDEYRKKPERLSSFILVFKDGAFKDFNVFEKAFWDLLKNLDAQDKKYFQHDPRVSKDPSHGKYSFSLKEEGFFIVALHPTSPRFSRRFKYPAIVFNPHQQFEELRNKGVFTKIRNLIRTRDKWLQGFSNPMLQDFGERSEVFQYLGRIYSPNETVPLIS